jgi:hypothetical protein
LETRKKATAFVFLRALDSATAKTTSPRPIRAVPDPDEMQPVALILPRLLACLVPRFAPRESAVSPTHLGHRHRCDGDAAHSEFYKDTGRLAWKT